MKGEIQMVQEIGDVIKRYGRFLLRELQVRKDERILPSAMLQITVEDEPMQEVVISSIAKRHSEFSDVKQRVHDWLRGRHFQVQQIRQWLLETNDIQMQEKFQLLVDTLESAYHIVEQALYEIEPEYQIEEVVAHRSNINYRNIDGKVYPVVETNTIIKDFGQFRLYEIKEARQGNELSNISWDVCLSMSSEGVITLGNIAANDVDEPRLQEFLNDWLESQKQGINNIKKRLQETSDPELKARLQRILSWQEPSFKLVQIAAHDLDSR